jgi:PhzF family phenazine biosynthesis protein
MTVRLRLVDAFTDGAFGGNPAAVCVLDGSDWPDDAWLASVAREMNQPMTAFARRLGANGDGGAADWGLRWFNAHLEEHFCGHATLATAHVLFSDGDAQDRVSFATRAGVLTAAARDGDGVTLDFPRAQVTERDVPTGLAEAIRATPAEVYGTGSLNDIIAILDSEATVRRLEPDLDAVGELLDGAGLRGLVVTAQADEGGDHDIVSRFFSPHQGIPEDAVTGSAHTALAPLWSARLGRDRLVALQVSPRGGRMVVEVAGDRVRLTGRAVTVVEGALRAI